MEIIDTNILYYKFKDKKYKFDISNKNITSINALEFLRNIEKIKNNAAKYYIPLDKVGRIQHIPASIGMHRGRPFNKMLSDSILFQFNNEFPSYNLYNNLSVQQVINNKRSELLRASIDFLPKHQYKYIYDRYKFILDSNLNCISLSDEDLELSLELLSKFTEKYSLKGDFRNSWNDLLIAATAINKNYQLISNDSTLNQFVASEFDVKKKTVLKNIVEYDFSKKDIIEKRDYKLESKGYINKSWNYFLRKN